MRVWERVRRALLPDRCICCGTVLQQGTVCEACRRDLPRATGTNPVFCGRFCKRAVAPFYYKDHIRAAARRLKYKNSMPAVAFFAEEMAHEVRTGLPGIRFDLVTNVPMEAAQLRRRGYNPAARLARETAKCLGLPWIETLRQVRRTGRQHTLPEGLRATNVTDAYKVAGADVRGKTVLLADDILTTGSTLEECAKMLQAAGATQVYGVCAARTLLRRRRKRGR